MKIGLTGGIGSGKSILGRLFAVLGIPVYQADNAAKIIMETPSEIKQAICNQLGTQYYTPNGQLRSNALSKHVFSCPHALRTLNNIVHPAVLKDFGHWCKQQRNPYCILEAALILESQFHNKLDAICLVLSPLALRMRRLGRRDPQRSPADLHAIMAQQIQPQEAQQKADHIIYNDPYHSLIQQAREVIADWTSAQIKQ